MTTTGGPTVFVIGDDDLVRAAIQGMLKAAGLQAETFATAQRFLRCKRPDGPSCLVLDVELPGVSGPKIIHDEGDFKANAYWGICNECGIVVCSGHGRRVESPLSLSLHLVYGRFY